MKSEDKKPIRPARERFPLVTDRAEADRLLGGARTMVIHPLTAKEIELRRNQRAAKEAKSGVPKDE